jgi:hypothetical protein
VVGLAEEEEVKADSSSSDAPVDTSSSDSTSDSNMSFFLARDHKQMHNQVELLAAVPNRPHGGRGPSDYGESCCFH